MPPEGAFFWFCVFVDVIFEISETLDMSSNQLGMVFEGDSADTCGGKFSHMSMGG